MRPVVDGIEQEYGDRLKVIRLDIQDPAVRSLAAEYGFRYTPTFVLLDAAGVEIWRVVGAFRPQDLRAKLASP